MTYRLLVLSLSLWVLPFGHSDAEELLKPVGGSGAGPTVGGLQATIRAVKEDFGPGESILIHWRLRNKDEAEKLVKIGQSTQHPIFFSYTISRDGKDLGATMKSIIANPVEKKLRGGGQLDLWIDLRTLPWAEPKLLDQKGSYEVVLNYRGSAGGEVPSGKATFRVVAAGTQTFPRLDPALAERIKTLITKLGADDFAAREAAHNELMEIGRDALGPLTESLATTDDPEIRLRCQNLIDKIRQSQQRPSTKNSLCNRCINRGFTADIGRCRQCRGHTSSGSFIYCHSCARRLNRCAACGQAIRAPIPPQPVPQPRPRPRPRRVQPLAPAPVPPPVVPPDDF